jgi:ATP-dependent exoDNAse (exonuclease V) alpha subunit
MALTAHQNENMEIGLAILEKEERLLIKGSAGTGKTYMLNEFIKAYSIKNNVQVVCSAPTNKAVAVLKGKVDNRYADFQTLASLLKIRRKVNEENGEVTFEPVFSSRNKPLQGVDIVFLDEASMVSNLNHSWLEEHAISMNVKIVYIGDIKQLPPVGEIKSTVFLGSPEVMSKAAFRKYFLYPHQSFVFQPDKSVIVYSSYPEIELLEIVRQKNANPIIDLSRNLFNIRSMENHIIDVEGVKNGYMYTLDRQKVVDTLATVNGTDDLKYLAYTNKDVDLMNHDVRKMIYGNPRKVEPGESLIFNAPYKDMYFNNQEIKVQTVEEVWQKFTITKATGNDEVELKVYVINGKKIEDMWYGVFVIHEHSEAFLKKLLYTTKKEAVQRKMTFSDRDEFLGQFADIKYNHALTVHKSQGSTYQQAIVNVSNLMTNKDDLERECLLYTAITRAEQLLILYF